MSAQGTCRPRQLFTFFDLEPLPSFGTEFVTAGLLGGCRVHPEAALNAVI